MFYWIYKLILNKNGLLLKYVSDNLKNDKDVNMLAIK